jgi:hypothetical protein
VVQIVFGRVASAMASDRVLSTRAGLAWMVPERVGGLGGEGFQVVEEAVVELVE